MYSVQRTWSVFCRLYHVDSLSERTENVDQKALKIRHQFPSYMFKWFNVEGSPVMDWLYVQRIIKKFLVASCYRTRLSSTMQMSRLAEMHKILAVTNLHIVDLSSQYISEPCDVYTHKCSCSNGPHCGTCTSYNNIVIIFLPQNSLALKQRGLLFWWKDIIFRDTFTQHL